MKPLQRADLSWWIRTLYLRSIPIAVSMGFGLIGGYLPASVVSFDFKATLETGPLSGTTFSGTGSYDTKGSTGTGLEFQRLITLDFILVGVRYTRADLVQGGDARFHTTRAYSG
jgi:hypothetical protein